MASKMCDVIRANGLNSLVSQLVSDGEGQVESVVLRQYTLPLGTAGAAQISNSWRNSKALR